MRGWRAWAARRAARAVSGVMTGPLRAGARAGRVYSAPSDRERERERGRDRERGRGRMPAREGWRAATMADVQQVLEKTVRRCRERGIVIPTYAEMRDPAAGPGGHPGRRLATVGHAGPGPANLFRITWKNEPMEKGGRFSRGNCLEFPPELTGVPARIVGARRQATSPPARTRSAPPSAAWCRAWSRGDFDPTRQKALWPSTGNYCRGRRLRLRAARLQGDRHPARGDEPGALRVAPRRSAPRSSPRPGCESNVKEIYDKCWELRRPRGGDGS